VSPTPSSTINLSDKRIRGEETTTGVEVQEGSLTPLNDSISMPAIFQNPLVIRNILDDPRIGGLKLIVYEWVIYSSFMGLTTDEDISSRNQGTSRSTSFL
jgi:hypothetical protein